jgi:hypothetical protein
MDQHRRWINGIRRNKLQLHDTTELLHLDPSLDFFSQQGMVSEILEFTQPETNAQDSTT